MKEAKTVPILIRIAVIPIKIGTGSGGKSIELKEKVNIGVHLRTIDPIQ